MKLTITLNKIQRLDFDEITLKNKRALGSLAFISDVVVRLGS